MRIFEQDPRFLIIDDIRDSKILRPGYLNRIFNRQFDGAIHMSKTLQDVQKSAEEISSYLKSIFSGNNDEWEYMLHAESSKGAIHPPDIILTRQSRERDKRGSYKIGIPKRLLHEFGMSPEFGVLANIFSDMAKYTMPLTGKHGYFFIADKTSWRSETEEMHRDRNPNEKKRYNIMTMPLARHLPATIFQSTDGKIIRPPAGAAVILNDCVEHSTPEGNEFRPIIAAQASTLSFRL